MATRTSFEVATRGRGTYDITREVQAAVARAADAVVVGSAIVDAIEKAATPQQAVADALALTKRLADAAHQARK